LAAFEEKTAVMYFRKTTIIFLKEWALKFLFTCSDKPGSTLTAGDETKILSLDDHNKLGNTYHDLIFLLLAKKVDCF